MSASSPTATTSAKSKPGKLSAPTAKTRTSSTPKRKGSPGRRHRSARSMEERLQNELSDMTRAIIEMSRDLKEIRAAWSGLIIDNRAQQAIIQQMAAELRKLNGK